MPAPTKLTEENITEIERRFREGATTLEAIEGVMGESTYYDHLKNNIAFSERMELAREYVTEIARGVVAKAIKRGDRDTAKWWLERRNKKKFGTNVDVTTNGKDLPTPILGGLSQTSEAGDVSGDNSNP